MPIPGEADRCLGWTMSRPAIPSYRCLNSKAGGKYCRIHEKTYKAFSHEAGVKP